MWPENFVNYRVLWFLLLNFIRIRFISLLYFLGSKGLPIMANGTVGMAHPEENGFTISEA